MLGAEGGGGGITEPAWAPFAVGDPDAGGGAFVVSARSEGGGGIMPTGLGDTGGAGGAPPRGVFIFIFSGGGGLNDCVRAAEAETDGGGGGNPLAGAAPVARCPKLFAGALFELGGAGTLVMAEELLVAPGGGGMMGRGGPAAPGG